MATKKERDDDIVISGISGRFPESNNIAELRDNLMNKVDLLTDDDRRWRLNHPEIPQRTGKVNNIEKFDADYFGINFKHAHIMDPMGRMVLEHAYEAIVDAGVNPKHLRGTNTGVFIGSCFAESEITWIYQKRIVQCNFYYLTTFVEHDGIIGCCKSMLGNRISHWLDIHGPSYTVDSACSSSLFAMEHAYRAIRNGICDAALVGGTNLCLHPNVSLQFTRLGVLSPDGRSKTFDADANGYVRSETISVAFLQKSKDAKRIYATVVHAKTNCDGFKEEGITFPSSSMQSVLLKEFYEECKVSPSSLAYLEAHGTGTKVGDPEELNAIETVFCPGREEPLKIGSVKSNIGHAEPASGMGQIAKIVIANETGIIPPSLHYKRPREGVKILKDGRVQVITEPTEWNGGYAGVSSFGFGGANAHILLKSNPKGKINDGAPGDDLPRLVLVSGRTEAAVGALLADVESRPIDVEYVRLLQNLHAENISGHHYRGYTILGSSTQEELRDIQYYSERRRPVWFIFSGIGSQWPRMGESLLRFPIFANAIRKCDAVLKHHTVDIHDILLNPSKSIFDNILKSIVGIAAVQIGLVDLLAALGIEADGMIGDSVGELGCAYADGCFSTEQMILSAYSLGLALIQTKGDTKNPYPTQTGPKLLDYVNKIIPNSKRRSAKWFSSSIPRSQWNSSQAEFPSTEYHSNNLLTPSVLEETLSLIPKNAVTIEIAPHGLLQATLTKSLASEVLTITLSQSEHKESLEFFLNSIGKLYKAGLQPAVWKLYPEVEFPVSRGTPMLNHLIKWDHSEDWYVTSYRNQERIKNGERIVELSLADEEYEYMGGHVIDGRILLPATGYLALIWETVGLMRGEFYSEVPVVFEDVKFLRATTLSKEELKITLMIQKGTGRFEVVEGGVAVVTGSVRHTPNPQDELIKFPLLNKEEPEEMSNRDVYKELRLRGYQYSGLFRAIKSATTNGSKGTVAWANNWVSFMDNMLQVKILGLDTRNLLVPTGIRKLTIDPQEHIRQIRNMLSDEKEFKIYTSDKHDVIHSGGVQICGLQASSISRRKPPGEPVLEAYNFVAHRDRAECSLQEAIYMATHLALENHLGTRVKTLESLDPGERYPREDLFSLHIAEVLTKLPMIQADVNIITPEDPFEEGEAPQAITIADPKKLTTETNALMIAGRNLVSLKKRKTLNHLLATLKDGAFVLTLESSSEEIPSPTKVHGLQIVLEKSVKSSTLLLLKKPERIPKKTIIIQVNNEEFTWLNELKAALKAEAEREVSGPSRVLLTSDKTFENGLLGLINCIRKEPGGEIVRAFLIQDPVAPDFSLSEPLYTDQLMLNLAINVLRPAAIWGSYRHLHLPPLEHQPQHHAWVNQLVKGDLTSFRWMQGTITPAFDHSNLISVVYSSINFKDIMIATGKLNSDIFVKSRTEPECLLGFEYSGVMPDGRRVMGIIPSCAITNVLNYDPKLTWRVPDSWSLEEAVTVPCVYATCCYALYYRGRMRKGEKVLIHAGSGGVGQAAINLALWTGCEVFTTVGTEEKRAFIRNQFPEIPDDHIGNSRDTSFEQMVMEGTGGRGVDIVLNSLAEEKLQASVRCLSYGGRFLEIGKFDMANDNYLGMSAFLKEISFYGVLLDKVFDAGEEKKMDIYRLMQRAIDDGAVKPLNVTVFSRDEIEQAFRYMAAGKHIGKVVLKIQDENNRGKPIPAFPRYYCLEDRAYLILGGLGGFGLELADWLVLRGARSLILTSRSGVKNGYQRMRIKVWESYGVTVTIVSGKDSSNPRECREILSIASKKGPVDGIYNLAVILKDGLLENQTPETFEESFKSKARTTKNLDELSRELCPKLRHFVVFSSVSCGRGNAGQTNYGMSNSVMERICEMRASEGLPALAIQWGAIGDVGLVADMQDDDKELVIGGTLQQKITSCLHELDGFLNQKSPIVASMVVAEKRGGSSGALNLVDTVLNIMGLKDLKSVGVHTPLTELGMDSMMAVEIKQTLEREFEIFLTAQDIRGLNFSKLIEMNSTGVELKKESGNIVEGQVLTGMKLLVRLLGEHESMKEVCLKLPTKEETGRQEVFLVPGIEGCGSVFMNIAGKIRAPATCLQLCNTDTKYLSIQEMANKLLPHFLERTRNRTQFILVGYSYGSIVAIELARKLESLGFNGKIIIIDGSAEWMKEMKNQQLISENNDKLETNILVGMCDIAEPTISGELFIELQKCESWEEKLDFFMKRVRGESLGISIEQRKNICTCIYMRLLALDNYDTLHFSPIKSSITLLKSTVGNIKSLPEDYGLGKMTQEKVQVHLLEGDHVTILDNPKVATVINDESFENQELSKSSMTNNVKLINPINDAILVKSLN